MPALATGGRLSAKLHHIALGSPDPEALAAFHQRAMGLRLRPTPQGILGEAPGRQVFFVPGEAKSLAFAGFAVDNAEELQSLESRLKEAEWPYEVSSQSAELFEGGAIAVTDPDGNQVLFGTPKYTQDSASDALPARLQHVVVASRDAARMCDFYQRVLGFTLSDIVLGPERKLMTAFLRCSEEHHSFAVFQASTDRFDHHCYEAGDWGLIRDWGDHFASHRIKVEWGPGRHGPGNNLFLFVHDLDGNWLEISAELEIVEPDRPAGEWPHEQHTLNSWGTAPLRT